jgi:hypothetical protein
VADEHKPERQSFLAPSFCQRLQQLLAVACFRLAVADRSKFGIRLFSRDTPVLGPFVKFFRQFGFARGAHNHDHRRPGNDSASGHNTTNEKCTM